MTAHPTAEAAATFPRPADLELVPIELGPSATSGQFLVGPAQTRPDGALYGGAIAAAAVIAMEAATRRDALWLTTQFVSPAQIGDLIRYDVRILAQGRRVAQIEMVARTRDEVVFTALGATALPRPDGLNGQYETMPAVTAPPEESEPPDLEDASAGPTAGYRARTRYTEVTMAHDHPAGAMALWAELTNGTHLTPAAIAYLADIAPVAVARGAGKLGAGISLDNSIRFGPLVATRRILLELRGHMASGGYGHSSLTAWTPDGTIVATGSQTTNMVYLFEPGGPIGLKSLPRRRARE